MTDLLKGKICVVTGGSRGIGRSIVEEFANQGAKVFAIASQLASFEDWLPKSEFKNRIYPMGFDITDNTAIKESILSIRKMYGKIDVLVNNAGVEYNERIGMISRVNMEKMFKVNVFAAIEFIQLTSRIMSRKKSGGSIINIASIVGDKGNPGQLVYSATKGALISLTKSSAKELAINNIRVNAISPGLTKTDMMEQVDIEKLQERIDNIGLGRIAEPKDVANAVLFLASDLSNYISGQILGVDGSTII